MQRTLGRALAGLSMAALIAGAGIATAQTSAPGMSGAPDTPRQTAPDSTPANRTQRPAEPGQRQSQPSPQQGQPSAPSRAQSPDQPGTQQRREAQPAPQQGQQPSQRGAQTPDQSGTPQRREAQPQQGQQPSQRGAQTPDQSSTPQRREAQPQLGQQPSQRGAQTPDQPGTQQRREAQPQQGQPSAPSRAQSPDQPGAQQRREAQPSPQPGQMPSQRGAQQQPGQDATVTGSISSNPEQATRLRQSIEQSRVPEARVNVNVRVGSTLPRNVTLVAPPPALIEIAPRYRDYRVVRVRDELVIVEPGTYRVVEVVHLSSGRVGQAGGRTLMLTAQQREIVRRHALESYSGTTTRIRVVPGRPLSQQVELMPLPDEVYSEVPTLREYQYFVSGRQIIIVDPSTKVVAQVIR
jgi:hypothetical protein